MNYWRMKLRNGSHGEDLWDVCKRESVVAITYPGIQDVDLQPYSRENYPPGWKEIKFSGPKGSLAHFAWDIKGGDAVYIGDSVSRKIVGMGFARAKIGALAYRFDARSPISPRGEYPWCHLIDMDWDNDFAQFSYRDRAPQTTVLKLEPSEIRAFARSEQVAEHHNQGLTDRAVRDALLLETCYPRYTPAARRLIRRKHVILSNCFMRWLASVHGIRAIQERKQLDATFQAGGKNFLVEFKIAYHGDTKRAIREALGQILEYNHYPPRQSHEHWLLILDAAPQKDDVIFLRFLRKKFLFPLSLGWQTDSAFDFDPPLSL